MTWGWSGTGEKSVALGGQRGTPEEAAEGKAWPKYEMQYLKHRLDHPAGKYLMSDGQPIQREVKQHILLEKAAEDYKEEADECLKAEFKEWLAGKHPENRAATPYMNGDGKPIRRYTYRDQLTFAPPGTKIGDPMLADMTGTGSRQNWVPTWWGTNQLTHLPGVREYLRSTEQKRSDADVYMNLLAEHGPQDLKSAWMYFKHWVKGRPVAPETCPTDEIRELGANEGKVPTVPGFYVSDEGKGLYDANGNWTWSRPKQYALRQAYDFPDAGRSDFGMNAPDGFVTQMQRPFREVEPNPATLIAAAVEGATESVPLDEGLWSNRIPPGRRSSIMATESPLAVLGDAINDAAAVVPPPSQQMVTLTSPPAQSNTVAPPPPSSVPYLSPAPPPPPDPPPGPPARPPSPSYTGIPTPEQLEQFEQASARVAAELNDMISPPARPPIAQGSANSAAKILSSGRNILNAVAGSGNRARVAPSEMANQVGDGQLLTFEQGSPNADLTRGQQEAREAEAQRRSNRIATNRQQGR